LIAGGRIPLDAVLGAIGSIEVEVEVDDLEQPSLIVGRPVRPSGPGCPGARRMGVLVPEVPFGPAVPRPQDAAADRRNSAVTPWSGDATRVG
jgi:hypothetical protein